MKQISHATIISLVLLLMICNTSARLLPSHQGDNPGGKPNETTQQEVEVSRLMGSEECGDEDEECEKRRMVAEAHLDYIYTQHQHP